MTDKDAVTIQMSQADDLLFFSLNLTWQELIANPKPNVGLVVTAGDQRYRVLGFGNVHSGELLVEAEDL